MSAPTIETQDTPPVPDGSVMVTLKIARFNPEDPDAHVSSGDGRASESHACPPTGCSTCCTT